MVGPPSVKSARILLVIQKFLSPMVDGSSSVACNH